MEAHSIDPRDAEIERLNSIIERQTETCRIDTNQISEQQKTIARLTAELGAAREENTAIHRAIDGLEKENDSIAAERDQARASLESYKAAAKLATGRADMAEADLAAANLAHTKAVAMYETAAREAATYQRVVEAAKAWARRQPSKLPDQEYRNVHNDPFYIADAILSGTGPGGGA